MWKAPFRSFEDGFGVFDFEVKAKKMATYRYLDADHDIKLTFSCPAWSGYCLKYDEFLTSEARMDLSDLVCVLLI